MATKGHFHIITVNLYIFNFTSELLSAESSSSLLVFPVRGEQRKHQLFIPYTAVKMALSSLISNEFSRLWGGKKKKSWSEFHSVAAALFDCSLCKQSPLWSHSQVNRDIQWTNSANGSETVI